MSKYKIVITIVIAFLTAITCVAQKKEQRIFLWDVSHSLKNNNMWEPLKKVLIDGISNIDDPETKIVLVKFYSGTWAPVEVQATPAGKEKLINEIKKTQIVSQTWNGYTNQTNIVEAMKKFHALVKPDYINYMFLFTDGQNEIGNLCDELNHWPSKTKGKYCYGFYVLVDDKAKNQCVTDAAKKYDNFWIVPDANAIIKICNISNQISYNNRDEKDKIKRLNIEGNT